MTFNPIEYADNIDSFMPESKSGLFVMLGADADYRHEFANYLSEISDGKLSLQVVDYWPAEDKVRFELLTDNSDNRLLLLQTILFLKEPESLKALGEFDFDNVPDPEIHENGTSTFKLNLNGSVSTQGFEQLANYFGEYAELEMNNGQITFTVAENNLGSFQDRIGILQNIDASIDSAVNQRSKEVGSRSGRSF